MTLLAGCLFAAALVVLVQLARIDWRTGLLPDALTQPLLWGGLALAWTGDGLVTLDVALISAMVSYLALRAVSELYWLICQREGLGRGDVKLVAAVSAWLGWHDTLWVVVLGGLFGLLLALVQLRRGIDLRAPRPFGPPLILATLFIAALSIAKQGF